MGFWDQSGYDDSWSSGDVSAPTGGFPGFSGGSYDPTINREGAASDPFAYTKGSLLTPWEGRFDSSKYGSGVGGVAEYKPFQFGDFSYRAANPGTFDERYNDPGNFVYGDYTGPGAFKGVTDKDMKADKGFQVAVERGQKALMASKAAQGILRTGGTAKGLGKYNVDTAMQHYGDVYGRKLGEYQMADEQGRFRYGTNRANTAENFDRNISNARQGYQIRQGTWKDNAAVQLDASRHGYDVAQGTYDRNLALHRQGYEDERSAAQAAASAGAAGSREAYGRALDDYNRSRDEFWTNQDRQYAILDREANRGYDAARDYGYAQAGLATDRGNAQASGRVGSANAWNGALGSIGQGISDAAMYYGTRDSGTSGGGTTSRRY